MEIKRFIGGMLEANCYVVRAGKPAPFGTPAYIIDPGYNPKNIIKYVKEQKLDVKGVILTHHHYDHTEGARRICKELECPAMIHMLDADEYKDQVDRFLEHGDVLEFQEDCPDRLVVLHTPGHTRGGICLYSGKSRLCFTGDTIFNVDLGRTDLEDGSEEEMRKSIRNVCDKWENDITIYPGHGDPATMKYVRKNNNEFIEMVKND